MYDVVIIGGGPAGLTAALYTTRRNLKTLVISKDIGGQAATTSLIENYPGVGPIDGFELMKNFKDQAVTYGAEFSTGEMHTITQVDADHFKIDYNDQTIQSRTVILAFGLTPRSLGVPGEDRLTGKGVFYSTGTALDSMHGKVAMVVGGGNSAIESVNVLADIAKKVYLVHRRDRFRAEDILVSKMESSLNVERVLNAQVAEIHGKDSVTSVTVKHNDDTEQQIMVDAVFMNVGFMSKTNIVSNLVELNKKNEIITQADCSTNTPGVFAAGDITTQHYKQVIVSAAEGCKAALACYTYIMHKDGKEVSVDQDWDVSSKDHFIRT